MWVPAKAELAQWLLERSWSKVRAGADHAPPWPWADTQAVAVLEAPSHGVRQLVLAGDSGRNLAFGPALHGSLDTRDLVISGHRDTHFAFLQLLQPGDRIVIETRDGRREYVAAFSDIVDTDHHALVLEPGVDRLSLVTCYPFNAILPGGPLRYVVTALPSPTMAPEKRPQEGNLPPKHTRGRQPCEHFFQSAESRTHKAVCAVNTSL